MSNKEIVFDDDEFNAVLKEALALDPETTQRILRVLVNGCHEIDRFERAIETARVAPFEDETSERHDKALDDAVIAFAKMLDIFGEAFRIAAGVDDDGAE